MQTILSVDVGVIATAAATVATVLAVAYNARKEADRKHRIEREEAMRTNQQLKEIHSQGNSFITREMRTRLAGLKVQKVVLERVIGDDMDEEHLHLIVGLEQEIEDLSREVARREREARHSHYNRGTGQ